MKDMKSFRRTYAIVTSVVSLFFAVMLFVAIVDVHGVALSVLYVAIGVAAIWGIYYFFLGSVFRHFYEEGRREGRRGDAESR